MPKMNIEYLDGHIVEPGTPSKIHTCSCTQCKSVKNKRSNRKYRKFIKRMLNKQRRKGTCEHFNFYFA